MKNNLAVVDADYTMEDKQPAPHGYAWQERLLSPDDCQTLIEGLSGLMDRKGEAGTVFNKDGYKVDKETRQSDVLWLEPWADSGTIGDNYALREACRRAYCSMVGFAHAVALTTLKNYGFELDGLPRNPVQVSRYKEGAFYKDHADRSGAHSDSADGRAARVLSLTVSLNRGVSEDYRADYQGGEFEFQDCELPDNVVAALGSPGAAIAFPSTAVHRVNAVTRGERWSLVLWATGKISNQST